MDVSNVRERLGVWRPQVALAALACLGGAAIAGCAAGDQTLDEVDPADAPTNPTYSRDVAPIMEDFCVDCHPGKAVQAQTRSNNRRGGDDQTAYGNCTAVKAGWRGLVLTTFQDRSMPPPTSYMLSSRDMLTLQRWWDQGGTCD